MRGKPPGRAGPGIIGNNTLPRVLAVP